MRELTSDEIKTKFYDIKLAKRAYKYVLPYKKWFLICLGLFSIATILELLGPYIIKRTIDVYIVGKNVDGIKIMAFVYFIIIIVVFISSYFQFYLLQATGQKIIYDVRVGLYKHLQKLALSFHNKNPIGRLMTRVINDVETLNQFLTEGVITILADVIIITGIIGIMVAFNWKLALFTFITIPFVVLATYLFRRYAISSYRKIKTFIARINTLLQENITGISTIQIFLREKENFKRFDKVNSDYKNEFKKVIFYHALYTPTITLLSSIAIVIIVYFGGKQVVSNIISVGIIVAFIAYIERFFQPIQDLAEKYNIMQNAMTSAERIFNLLDTNEFIKEPVKPVFPKEKGVIDFHNVWFSYNNKDWVLKNINLKIADGECIAIVGSTGAGKTSLVSILTRLYDIQKGRILIDNVNIKSFELSYLRSYVGLILQDPFIFSGNVIDNIRLGNSEIPDEHIQDICRKLSINKWIESLPNGYREVLRERGSNISTGQKQLLAFARVLVHKPKILVIDEATSNVDPHTEWLLHNALKEIIKGRTSIIIAHRLSTIKYATRILVFKNGEIAEQGSHTELMKKPHSIYANLYKLQFQV